MNHSFLLPPPSRLDHPFDGETERGGGPLSEMSRRKFLKRTGMVSVAALVLSQELSRRAYGNLPQPEFGSSGFMELIIRVCLKIRPGQDVEIPEEEPEEGWTQWFDQLLEEGALFERKADLLGVERAIDDGTWKAAPEGTFDVSKPGGDPPSIMIGGRTYYSDNATVCHVRMVKK